MKKLSLLCAVVSTILFASNSFGATFTLSDYHWNETIPTGNVNEIGVKLGLAPDPIALTFLTPRLTYEPELDLMFLRYHGAKFYNPNIAVSAPSFHMMIDNNLDYKIYSSSQFSFSGYIGLHYIFRDIDPFGSTSTVENYIEPRVGLKASYNLTDKDSLHLEAYRPIHVWQFTDFGMLQPKPQFGYKGLISHQFNSKYALSLYGEYTKYGKSDPELMNNGYGYFYQPKIRIIQVGAQLNVKF